MIHAGYNFVSMMQITAPTFVAGVVFNVHDRVARAAPVIKYMTGWSRTAVTAYCKRRLWSVEWIDDSDELLG